MFFRLCLAKQSVTNIDIILLLPDFSQVKKDFQILYILKFDINRTDTHTATAEGEREWTAGASTQN